ncbi:uncharacterized protein [Tiliqua scincoides]|uniref:uncharacterized protein n=1 Tax=Tiliqua scincoides TaxID=71010 RepID=UPI003462D5C1
MESYPWRALLLLGIVVAATALAPPREAVSYEEALTLAVDLYNQESETGFAFRLLEAKPQPEWNPLSQGVQELEFTVKETTCPAKELPSLQECGFMDNGRVQTCSGTLAVEQGAHVIQLDCDTTAEEHIRVRRGGFRKLKRKLKKAIKKGLKRIFAPHPVHLPQGPGGRPMGHFVSTAGQGEDPQREIPEDSACEGSSPESHMHLVLTTGARDCIRGAFLRLETSRLLSQPLRMESCPQRTLLLLGIVVAATALAPPQKAVSYEEALSLAVDLYNRELETGFAFRLLEAKPQPEWDPWSQVNQKVHFTMKETTCPTSVGLSLERCNFKDDGVVEECYGTFSVQQRAAEFHCEHEDSARIRVRRNATGNFIQKIKNKLFRPGSRSLIAQRGHGRNGNVQRA